MRIIIEYESSWRNSFLDGSNSEPLPKGGRNFIGSMTTLKQAGNFIQRSITKDTVMGVLNRLIGEQRKLYQVRQDPNYYFADIEVGLQEVDIVDKPSITQEMVYIRNITGSTDQNSFTGMIKANDLAFQSDFSSALWGILWLTLEEVIDFILNGHSVPDTQNDLDPITVIEQLEILNAEKPVEVEQKVKQALERIQQAFPEVDYKLTSKGQLTPISLYTSALYIQLEKLKDSFDLSSSLTKAGGLSGISKRGFTKKDFMDRYTTGCKKLIWGNPYLLKEKKKGEGEVVSKLTKASGQLEIHLNIPKERAKDLELKIENAGVSAFYLGKKGLAYVKDIRI